jgi:hypothetical protein
MQEAIPGLSTDMMNTEEGYKRVRGRKWETEGQEQLTLLFYKLDIELM